MTLPLELRPKNFRFSSEKKPLSKFNLHREYDDTITKN